MRISDSAIAEETIEAAVSYLLKRQRKDGSWWENLETNVCMEAEYVFLTHCLDKRDDEREKKLMRYLLSTQTESGAWVTYPGGPGDVNCTVEAYQALKLIGMSEKAEPMQKARAFVLASGGVEQTRVFTRMWLALIGQYAWEKVPMVPPEIMLVPTFLPLNIYDFASWARATIVPLSVVMAHRPVFPLPEGTGIAELFVNDASVQRTNGSVLFNLVNRVLQNYQKWVVHPWRAKAEQKAIQWVVDHQEKDGTWGGIQPPWFYSLLALKTMDMTAHPSFQKGWEALEMFGVDTGDGRWWFQACISPTWDTGLAILALRAAGVAADHPALTKAGEWLLDQQVLTDGDWKVRRPKATGGGWPFEFVNDHYPDVDDTAIVLMALNSLQVADESRRKRALVTGFRWLMEMQSKNGGWAAFDADNLTTIPRRIPFSDFGAVTDPPSEDVTAHVIECVGMFGYDAAWGVVQRGINYLRQTQQREGSWFGRWGVNYVYGTGAVLPALAVIGLDMQEPWIVRALDWLEAHQNPDGGWGESCLSYEDDNWRGRGASTPSQTAWALMGLVGGGRVDSLAARRAFEFLRNTQRADGGWNEAAYTGTGFPRDFYIGYRLYAQVYPLIALGRYKQALGRL